jgi:mannose-6-phosphate isomerase-like protein (cupin superfamily)
MSSALERCVGDIDVFARDHWGRLPLVTRHTSSFHDVFNLDDVDSILTAAPRRPAVRLVSNGVPVDPRAYTTPTRIGGRDLDDVVDPARVATEFRSGATVVLQSLHRTHPRVSDFVAVLERDISHTVQANAYLTPPNSAGLTPHRDEHGVLVIQLAGCKRWAVEGLGEFIVSEGDCLYIPGGTTHSAATADVASLHLTLGIMTVTYRAVLERILRVEVPSLDHPLPIDYRRADADADEVVKSLTEIFEEVVTSLVALDVQSIAEREQARRRALRPRPGAFGMAAGLAAPRHDQMIRWSAIGSAIRPTTIGSRLGRTYEVVTGKRTVTLPEVTRVAVRQIMNGPVAVGDLAGLDADSQIVVARRLTEESLCRIEDAL